MSRCHVVFPCLIIIFAHHFFMFGWLVPGSRKTSTSKSSSDIDDAAAALMTSAARPGVVTEYCEREYFDADCSATTAASDRDRLIVARSAVFGRMKDGKCVRREYGSIGCRADVLPAVDAMCSGRRRCRFHVSTLHSARPCPTELVSYLEANFDCVTGSSLQYSTACFWTVAYTYVNVITVVAICQMWRKPLAIQKNGQELWKRSVVLATLAGRFQWNFVQ